MKVPSILGRGCGNGECDISHPFNAFMKDTSRKHAFTSMMCASREDFDGIWLYSTLTSADAKEKWKIREWDEKGKVGKG